MMMMMDALVFVVRRLSFTTQSKLILKTEQFSHHFSEREKLTVGLVTISFSMDGLQ
jgi:hypothetical protein